MLGLQRRYEDEWAVPVVLCAGSSCVAFFACDVADPGPAPDVRRSIAMRHLAFRLAGDAWRDAQKELRRAGIAFTSEDHCIARSVYLFDPDGHRIELTTYDV